MQSLSANLADRGQATAFIPELSLLLTAGVSAVQTSLNSQLRQPRTQRARRLVLGKC